MDDLAAPIKVTRRNAFMPAMAALLLPLAAFALAWLIAGKIPLAVPAREWGTWFFIGPLLGITGIIGLVFAGKAFARGGQRTLAVAGLILNTVVILIAWAGLFG
jgi:hypothetical protein